MNNSRKTFQITLFLLFGILSACSNFNNPKSDEKENSLAKDSLVNLDDSKNLLSDYIPLFEDGDINVAVEIPAGTLEKWEVDKSTGQVKLEYVDGNPRIINYLGYPGNYGMVPRTLLPKELGGDGDPLDVIALGPPVERGSVIKCKLIGVMILIDRGEQDDKLIAVMENSPLYGANNLEELIQDYNGARDILLTWFINYKGVGKMESKGFGDKEKAFEILHSAIEAYQISNNK